MIKGIIFDLDGTLLDTVKDLATASNEVMKEYGFPVFSDEEICTNEENSTFTFLMPGTERYHTETCTLPPVGIFRAKQTVKIFGEESVVEKTVIVCPLWLIFVILFVIIALVIWIIIKVRSHGKAKSRASAE